LRELIDKTADHRCSRVSIQQGSELGGRSRPDLGRGAGEGARQHALAGRDVVRVRHQQRLGWDTRLQRQGLAIRVSIHMCAPRA
jgi:hypothetical protein